MLISFFARQNIQIIVRQHNLTLFLKNIKSLGCYYRHSSAWCNKSSVDTLSKMDVDAPYLKTSRSELLQIFDAAVSAVFPNVLIEDQVKIENNELVINGESYPLEENVYLVGFGKAVAGMAFSMERILGNRLKRGIVCVPATSLCIFTPEEGKELKNLQEQRDLQIQNLQMLKRSKVIEYKEGAKDNQPDDDSLAATESIIELVKDLGQSDTLIVLISGGGSALLFQPKEPVSSEVKRDLCKKLQNSGASITELNTVRKVLSTVKGGGLAKIAYPAKLLTLILSDIVGDPIDYIASGPTCPLTSENPHGEAIKLLEKYNLYTNLDQSVKELLSSEVNDDFKVPTKDGKFEFVNNIIIGSNINALNAAKKATPLFNLESCIIANTIEGGVENVSLAYAKFTRSVCLAIGKNFPDAKSFINDALDQNVDILQMDTEKLEEVYKLSTELAVGNGILLIGGGEPTVVVKGCGFGGRNQELALRFSVDWLAEIEKTPALAKYFVQFLSVGTDGQDGQTNAAGAFGRPGMQPIMTKIRNELFEKLRTTPKSLVKDLNEKIQQVERMYPINVLERNDSYCFFKKFERGENLVKTGLTGTNVMDLHFIYIRVRACCRRLEEKDSDDAEFSKKYFQLTS